MKRYLIPIGFIFLVFFIVSYGYFITQKADVKLTKPDGYAIGELVTLDATASKADEIVWKILPETANFKIKGKQAYFSSSEPIDYTLILVARYNRNLDCKVFVLKYKEKEVKVERLNDFEKTVKTWLNDNNKKDAALRLAQSFQNIAVNIDVFDTVDGIILATARANSDALGLDLEAWKPFLQQFQTFLEVDPPELKEHEVIWKNMATALKKIFNAKT